MIDVQLRENENGGIYDNGRALPQMFREKCIDLYHNGVPQREISRRLRKSLRYVQNVLSRYIETNDSQKSVRSEFPTPKITNDGLEYIEVQKLMKPSVYGKEIQDRLLLDGVVHPNDLPSVSQINKVIHNKLVMTHKKIASIPLESTTPQVEQRTIDFLAQIGNIYPEKLHFFDESSVVKTTGNRMYGMSRKGEPAIEIQRYASNATYTINLLHSLRGVDYFNLLDGPSNGLEMLIFFEDALELDRPDGSAMLERGEYVVMDNCGFHHGRRIEPALRNMLQDCGINLIFQPPYSPHYNTCEYCFHQIKEYLRKNQTAANNDTKIAIADGIMSISNVNSYNYFKNCSYI